MMSLPVLLPGSMFLRGVCPWSHVHSRESAYRGWGLDSILMIIIFKIKVYSQTFSKTKNEILLKLDRVRVAQGGSLSMLHQNQKNGWYASYWNAFLFTVAYTLRH